MIFDLELKEQERTAFLEDSGRAVTYGQLTELCQEFGRLLSSHSLVFGLCENTAASAAGYVAALENEAVPLLLDAELGEEPLARFISLYRPDYFWAPLRVKEKVERLFSGSCIFRFHEYGLWSASCGDEGKALLHPDLCLLLATSGSTGEPKLVRLSRKNVMSNAQSIRDYLHLTEDERPITSLPMHYTYGLSVINSHLLAGACILMTRSSYVQQEFWEFLKREGATSFSGVPYTYQILKKMKLFRGSVPGLRTMTQAGGHLPEDLQREISAWAQGQGTGFYVMYGQTEATARMSYLPPDRCLDKIGSIGIPVPGGEFQLRDEQGGLIEEPDQEGELCFTGPNVSMGYAQRREDLSRPDERKGVLETGDLARRDAEGFYYITGRKKRFVKLFGIRVSLDACEQILRERFPDADLACAGEDEQLRIYTDKKEAADTAPDYLAAYLGLSIRAFSACYLPRIPRSSSGKILYDKL